MTWIKICGTTNLEDALTAVDAGADALGFVFYEKSPRKIEPEAAREIVAKLPSTVETIGLFVDEFVEQIRQTVQRVGLTGVQLHGNEDAAFIDRLARGWGLPSRKGGIRLVRVLPARPGYEAVAEKFQSGVDNFLLDSPNADQRGGTGTSFAWPQAVEFVARHKTIVAGGLNSTNVAEAIRILKPWGVDVASGVEASPGKKDPAKVRAFVDAVRRAEKKN